MKDELNIGLIKTYYVIFNHIIDSLNEFEHTVDSDELMKLVMKKSKGYSNPSQVSELIYFLRENHREIK